MAISVFQLFSIGIGPSSSHTVGPMRAARQFVLSLQKKGLLARTNLIKTELYGSLALTGKGHGTDVAILLGLCGYTPEGVDPNAIREIVAKIRHEKKLKLLDTHLIGFDEEHELLFHKDKLLPYHPNGMRFTAYDAEKKEIASDVYYSVGGGFIVDHAQASKDAKLGEAQEHTLPYPFKTAKELLDICTKSGMTIEDVMMQNELTWRSKEEIIQGLTSIWSVMKGCVERGCHQEGVLPGGLGVKRRACGLFKLLSDPNRKKSPAEVMEWVSLWALAVNEENAAGGRVVTAPTNGAAGVIPAVMHYYERLNPEATDAGIVTFMLTAGAIGILYKEGASISAAEMGCMGEVGVACSMAAAGLTAAMGALLPKLKMPLKLGWSTT